MVQGLSHQVLITLRCSDKSSCSASALLSVPSFSKVSPWPWQWQPTDGSQQSLPHPNKGPLSVVCWQLHSMRNRAAGSPIPSESLYGWFPLMHCSYCRSFCTWNFLVLSELTCSCLSWLTFCFLYFHSHFWRIHVAMTVCCLPLHSPQLDGLPWPFSTSFFKELAVLFKILFLFKPPSLETLSSLYWDIYIFIF